LDFWFYDEDILSDRHLRRKRNRGDKMNLVVLYNGAFVSGLIIGPAVADLPTDCKTMTVRIG
jgi:hypothetical protein